MLMVSPGTFAERTCVISFDGYIIMCFSCLLVSFPAASTRSIGINVERSADDVYSYLCLNKVRGFFEWMHKGVLTVSGVFPRMTLYFCSQRVRDLIGSTQNCVIMGSPRLSPTVGT